MEDRKFEGEVIKFKHLIRDDQKSSRMDLKTICLGQTLNTLSAKTYLRLTSYLGKHTFH